MVQSASVTAISTAASRRERLAQGGPPIGWEVPVVASESIVAEALAIALSSNGISARQAVFPAPEAVPDDSGPGAGVVVAGPDRSSSAPGMVGALTRSGRRVVVVDIGAGDDTLVECLDAGAEAIVAPDAGLGQLAAAVHDLSGEGAVRSPVDLEKLRARAAGPGDSTPGSDPRLESLTRREREVLAAIMAGRRPAAIARDDFVSLHTVRTQIRSMLRKLGVHSQVEAVALAHRVGWRP